MNTNAIYIMAMPVLCMVVAAVVLVIWATRTVIEQGSKGEVWAAFSKQIGGVFAPKALGMPDTVIAHIRDWPVYLDTYVVGVKGSMIDYTRLRAFYAVHKPFELTVLSSQAERDVQFTPHLTEVTSALPASGARMYSSNAAEARLFIADTNTMASLKEVIPLDLQIRRRRNWRNSGVSNSIYEVHVQLPYVVTDIKCLTSMYSLVSTCLERLLLLGYAHRSFADAGSALPTEQEPLS